MSGETPVISVLMGVLNCEKTLDESLGSLFAQTETRWELIICDDGSSDNTADVIRRWQDRYPDKIIFLRNPQNKGLSYTLNRCLSEAGGEFAARMDGDDLCAPDRFEKELRLLREHPEYEVVSTDMQCFDAGGVWGIRAYPTEPEPADLIHGTPFCHAACMVRREALVKAGGYSESEAFERVEDYELWVRMYAMGSRGKNIHEPLYQMRDDRNAAARRKWKYRVNEARVRALAVKSLGLPVWNYLYALRPLVMGLLPRGFSSFLHHQRLKQGLK
ncbi:MAG: glycosyltransferase [Flexilinea sp.]|nr:glycosyltransferase [Flexilinea sp.]